MRRFVTLVVLFLFTIPFGISISGCHKGASITYCNGGSTGPIVGQITTVTLVPKIYGVSLNFSQIGQIATPSATDCKGTTESSTKYTYGTTDMTIADVNPATGQLCGGTWNRNTGGAIPDFTTCNPTNKTGIAYITASTNGVTSNPLPVFVHSVVTSVVLGNPTPTQNCATDPDPSSNCCPLAQQATVTAPPYDGQSCLSQGATGQIVARAYQNASTLPKDNITCAVGHLTFTAQTSAIVTIDQNGVATAQQPGSTVVSANLTNAGSTAGFFSTCPPTSIALSVPGTNGGTSVTVTQNNTQPITVLAKDKNGTSLTGLNLTFQSTDPITIPVSGTGTVTPPFPGAAQITAVCQPPTCNPAPFNQIGFLNNGKQVSSNPISVTTPGTNSTILYIASTQSLYLVPVDFTTTNIGQPVRLPYVPNSMVISDDGSTIYMGSSNELMTFNAVTNSLAKEDPTITGKVLAVSPDGTSLVFTDPVRQLIYLYATSGGAIQTTYGGVATRAQFTPDSQTVYITAGSQLLVHSTFTGWTSIPLQTPATDVSVVTPSVGAFFGGATTTARGACPITTQTTANGQTTTTNVFYPDAGVQGPQTDRVAATNDGKHVLGATVTPAPTLTDLNITIPSGPCPPAGLIFPSTPVLTSVIPGITATAINGIVPTSNSAIAIITYTGSGGVLPTYTPAANGAGTLGSVKLSGTAIAPVSGVVSSDNTTFYVGTTGDNLVHLINSKTLVDDPTKAIAPKLPDANGNFVTPDLLAQKPRKATS
jgi:hypothetical protein